MFDLLLNYGLSTVVKSFLHMQLKIIYNTSFL